MSSKIAIRIVGAAAVAALAATAWLLFGPAQLGGSTHYAIIDGSSMRPVLSDGDLEVVRSDGEYRIGDVVLYRDPELRVDVLHRIVGMEGSSFILKGDSNDFLDDTRPVHSDLEGALWFSVPYAGSALAWVRAPLHAAGRLLPDRIRARRGRRGLGCAVSRSRSS